MISARAQIRTMGAPKVRAALVGGARPRWGQSCALICALVFSASAGASEIAIDVTQDLSVPSGQVVRGFDVVSQEDQPETLRFRYLAPEIGPSGLGYHQISDDFLTLCQDHALPMVAESGYKAGQIVITLMQQPVEFGVMTPDIPQYFERFSIQDNRCIWEAF